MAPVRETPRKKRRVQKDPPPTTSIGFISCEESMRLDTEQGLRKLKDTVKEMFEVGAEFISATSARMGVNMFNIMHDLKPFIDSLLISVAQPGGDPGYSCTKNSISFWSTSFATLRNQQHRP